MLPSPIPSSVVLIAGVLHSHHFRPPAIKVAMEVLRRMVLHNSAISNAVSAVCRIRWQGCVLHNVVLCCRGHVCDVNTQDFAGIDLAPCSRVGKLASNWQFVCVCTCTKCYEKKHGNSTYDTYPYIQFCQVAFGHAVALATLK